MSATIKSRIKFKRDNTRKWNAAIGFVPLDGEIIIYNDYQKSIEENDGEMVEVNIPGIKVGDGKTYVQDLPFVGQELKDQLMEHINNDKIHITENERKFWNDKLNVDDNSEVVNGVLLLNRN